MPHKCFNHTYVHTYMVINTSLCSYCCCELKVFREWMDGWVGKKKKKDFVIVTLPWKYPISKRQYPDIYISGSINVNLLFDNFHNNNDVCVCVCVYRNSCMLYEKDTYMCGDVCLILWHGFIDATNFCIKVLFYTLKLRIMITQRLVSIYVQRICGVAWGWVKSLLFLYKYSCR